MTFKIMVVQISSFDGPNFKFEVENFEFEAENTSFGCMNFKFGVQISSLVKT